MSFHHGSFFFLFFHHFIHPFFLLFFIISTFIVGDDSLGIVISDAKGSSFDDEADKLSVTCSFDGRFGRTNIVDTSMKFDLADWIEVFQHFGNKFDKVENLLLFFCIF